MFETFEFINEDFPWFFASLATIFGAVTGSFLNVCIYRIPVGRSVIFPGSSCACGRSIPFYHNIPIFTWLILRGKASCCEETFSIRYPAIELLTAILFYWVWTIHSPIVAIIGMLFVAFLICSTFIDLDHMIIPDRFSIHGLDGMPLVSNIHSGVTAIIGALIGAGLVYWIAALGEIIFRKPAMGEGDVKFVGFIGAFCGGQGAVFSMFGGALMGTIVLLPILLISRLYSKNKSAKKKTEEENLPKMDSTEEEDVPSGTHVPFGPMLAVAGLVYFLGFHLYVDAYFADFVFNFLTP